MNANVTLCLSKAAPHCNHLELIIMKLSTILCLAIPAVASAFSSPAFVGRSSTTMLNVVTGPKGKPAKDKDQDLELTREVIAEFMGVDGEDAAPEPKKEKKEEKKEE
jgi:hypothetical protein